MASSNPAITNQTPLLQHSELLTNDSKQRLVSLDVFRGLTVALMILVDDAGKAFPSINHAPWFGITLADFVMPFFLFGVGVSVALVFKKVNNRWLATKKVGFRTIKLFVLGIILQGGYFHGHGDLTYGVDLAKIRVMGVLQRIAIAYLLTSVMEIWLSNRSTMVDSDTVVSFTKRYALQIVVAVFLGLLYMFMMYGLYVADWAFEVSSVNTILLPSVRANNQLIHCRMRGSLEPPCNVVGYIDRSFLGIQHLYQRPVYRRTKECSVNSPDYGPLPSNSPAWCLAPFDPEGILRPEKNLFWLCLLLTYIIHFLIETQWICSSLMAAITCFVGLHYGHTLVHYKDHMKRVIIWSITSVTLVISGFLLNVLGVPFSKPLYTLSYMFVTSGASGLVLTAIYAAVHIKCIQKPTVIFQWMGMNALVVYALAACEIFPAALQGFYWRSPENNLVDYTEKLLQLALHSDKWGTLAFVLLEILFWGVFAGILHMKGIYMKL